MAFLVRPLQSLLIASLFQLASLPIARAAPPQLNYLFPAGARQGSTVEVSAAGVFEKWPVKAWVSRRGIEVNPAKDKGKLKIAVGADATPGICWIRVHDEKGASSLRPFIVGTLPEVNEQEPNDDPKKPHVLPSSSVVVNGRLGTTGDVDGFSVKLRKGDTLVASLEANRNLGSPMDAVLQIVSIDGFVLDQNNDDIGLDPHIVYIAPKDGDYLVRTFAFPSTPDSGIRFAGGETFVYRLTLTTSGFADHAIPLAVSRKAPKSVKVVGWNIPAAASSLTCKLDDPANVATLWHSQFANTVTVSVEPHDCVVRAASIDQKKAQTIKLPVTVSGCIDQPRVAHTYEFHAQKGQRLSFRVEARSAGSLLDPNLRLTDAAGKLIALADDSTSGAAGSRNAELTFNVPQDGIFQLAVRDQNGHGGFRHFYRLRAAPVEPDYSLSIATDRYVLTSGKSLEIPVAVARRNGLQHEIEVAVDGLPIGVTTKTVKSRGSEKSVTLRLEAKAGPVAASIRIAGRVSGQASLTRYATAPLSGLAVSSSDIWLTVTKD